MGAPRPKAGASAGVAPGPAGRGTAAADEAGRRERRRQIESMAAAALDACDAADREWRPDGRLPVASYRSALSRLERAGAAARELGEPGLV